MPSPLRVRAEWKAIDERAVSVARLYGLLLGMARIGA